MPIPPRLHDRYQKAIRVLLGGSPWLRAYGLTDVLLWLQERYNLPMAITRTGTSLGEDSATTWRIDYLRTHIDGVATASNGADVQAYYAWFARYFEWYGYSKRFGLVFVDYNTLKDTEAVLRVVCASYTCARVVIFTVGR